MSAMGPAIGAATSRRPRSTPTERPTHLMRCVDDKIVAIRQVADDMSDGDDASRRSNGSANGSHTPRLGSGDARRSLSRAQFASPSPPRGSCQLEVPFRGTLRPWWSRATSNHRPLGTCMLRMGPCPIRGAAGTTAGGLRGRHGTAANPNHLEDDQCGKGVNPFTHRM